MHDNHQKIQIHEIMMKFGGATLDRVTKIRNLGFILDDALKLMNATPCKLSFFQKLRHNEIQIFSTGITAILTSWYDSITDCVRSDGFSSGISIIVQNEKA
jgi:hypothetical protein